MTWAQPDRPRTHICSAIVIAAMGVAACGRTANPPRPAVATPAPSRLPAIVPAPLIAEARPGPDFTVTASGWRLDIKSWPNLVVQGSRTEVGGGAGGFYTQDQYRDLVLGAQGPRWTAPSVNFYRSPQVPWKN